VRLLEHFSIAIDVNMNVSDITSCISSKSATVHGVVVGELSPVKRAARIAR